jgi:hypothetical protein
MNEKPLGKITALLADLGLEVTYAYDDLVFVQDCAFLIQFTAEPQTLKLFINTECEPKEANGVAANIILKFDRDGFKVTLAGRYFLTPNENETVDISFQEA